MSKNGSRIIALLTLIVITLVAIGGFVAFCMNFHSRIVLAENKVLENSQKIEKKADSQSVDSKFDLFAEQIEKCNEVNQALDLSVTELTQQILILNTKLETIGVFKPSGIDEEYNRKRRSSK